MGTSKGTSKGTSSVKERVLLGVVPRVPCTNLHIEHGMKAGTVPSNQVSQLGSWDRDISSVNWGGD